MAEKNTILKVIIRILAIAGLVMTILPSILHFAGRLDMQAMKTWMAAGMFLWFLTGSFWLGKKSKEEEI
jgi:hypothetical protein